MSSAYIELHSASACSFLQGASLPEALVDRAAELGYSALALLDRDGVYGAPRFHKAALRAGIRPILGAARPIGATPTGPLAGPPPSTGPELTIASTLNAQRSSLNASDLRRQPSDLRVETSSFLLPVLCESQDGYRNLCRLITRMKLRAPAPGSPPCTPARWGGKGEGALTLEE